MSFAGFWNIGRRQQSSLEAYEVEFLCVVELVEEEGCGWKKSATWRSAMFL